MKPRALSPIVYVFLLLASIFCMAAILNEPWNTLLFVLVIPLLQQLFKLYRDKTGKTLGKLANQAISLVLALIFMVLNGGFAGVEWPIFPAWADDLVAFIGDLLNWAAAMITLIGLAWGSLMALYELILDKLFVRIGIATADKYQ